MKRLLQLAYPVAVIIFIGGVFTGEGVSGLVILTTAMLLGLTARYMTGVLYGK